MITTSPQPKMRNLGDVFPDGEMEDFKAKILSTHRNEASVFVVDAMNEKDAVSASAGVLFDSKPTDTEVTVNTADPPPGSHWLVAYLGMGPSHPARWIVERASIARNKIRLIYRKPELTSVTGDIQHYYYWVPLGKLKAGSYEVELYDAHSEAVTLSRRVAVGDP
jgi:hypothetical protein